MSGIPTTVPSERCHYDQCRVTGMLLRSRSVRMRRSRPNSAALVYPVPVAPRAQLAARGGWMHRWGVALERENITMPLVPGAMAGDGRRCSRVSW